MTFDEYFLAISRNVWPEGEARNLRSMHKDWLRDGLIDLQKTVSCLQTQNEYEFRQPDTFFYCGTSAFAEPNGYIQSVSVIPDLQNTMDRRQCDRVWATPVSKNRMECIIENDARCGVVTGCCYGIPFPYGAYEDGTPYAELPYGFNFAEPSTDRPCRSRDRTVAKWNGFIYLHPLINSDELILVEVHGVKKNWQGTDTIPYLDEEGEVDRLITDALETYLRWQTGLKDDCDAPRTSAFSIEYRRKRAELIWDCRKKNRIPKREDCWVDCNC